jgi:type IV fimbrial biogenesis protein FimT
MITIFVASIILGIAIPNMREFVLNNRMTSAANDLLAATHTARTEAIKRHSQTVLCFASDPFAAQPACDGSAASGWIVFVDDADPNAASANDNNVVVDVNEPVLVRHGALHQSITVNAQPAGNARYVAYNAAGFKRPVAAVGTMVDSVVLCDPRGNRELYGAAQSTARGFRISDTGRPAITRVVGDITTLGGCP